MKLLYLIQAAAFSFQKSTYFEPLNGWNNTSEIPIKSKDSVRVAIFGDSVSENTWAPQLFEYIQNDKNLKTNFEILGFAKGGATILSSDEGYRGQCIGTSNASAKGNCQYSQHEKWQIGIQSQPDIVIFMMGTNHANPFSWQFQRRQKQNLTQGFSEYIKTLDQIKTKPEINILSLPPVLETCCPTETSSEHSMHIMAEVYPPMMKSIASQFDTAHFLDLNKWMGGNNPVSQKALCDEQHRTSAHNPKGICDPWHYGYNHIAQFVFENVIQKADAQKHNKDGLYQTDDLKSQMNLWNLTSNSSLVQKTGVQKTSKLNVRQK